MAKYLLFLLLLLLRSNDVFAQNNACYCTTPWTENATFGQACTANPECWACQQGAYSAVWQQAFCPNVYQAPQACNQEVEFQTLSCPVNYSGIVTQSRTKTCPDNVWQAWTTTQNTCVANPPTCQTSIESQTLSCQTGYTGNITQTRSSTCPNPYGLPVMGAWMTTTNTCVKSVTNPTNVASPVSPANPAGVFSQSLNTSVQTTPSSPATVSTQSTAQSLEQTQTAESQTSTDGSSAQTAGSPATQTPAQTDVKSSQKDSSSTKSTSQPSTPAGRLNTPIGLVLSLELFVKPMIPQGNLMPEQRINNAIPTEMLSYQALGLELMKSLFPEFGVGEPRKFDGIKAYTVEIEQ